MTRAHPHIAILGSVGVPARYGGFETLAEQLARFHASQNRSETLSITCSARAFKERPTHFETANLSYLPLRANGASSVPYDILSLTHAAVQGADVALLLGVSGALALPFLASGQMRIVAHVDGQEWRREKWSRAARGYLKFSEGLAVRFADAVIADSPAIADELNQRYGRKAEVITYGGDQACGTPDAPLPPEVPRDYALAVCRIEPENNVDMILAACATAGQPLVFVGNWDASTFGRKLKKRYASHPLILLLDPIHDPGPLAALRRNAAVYLHGHSAGGTNPSLVEAMHAGRPVFAFDCIFNRLTTRNAATYFGTVEALVGRLRAGCDPAMGTVLRSLARAHYRWADIGAQYFGLFERIYAEPRNVGAPNGHPHRPVPNH